MASFTKAYLSLWNWGWFCEAKSLMHINESHKTRVKKYFSRYNPRYIKNIVYIASQPQLNIAVNRQ